MGISWPDPRFTDNGDGTITDNLSGLTWLRDTECIGRIKWLPALQAVNAVASGNCGLTDGSVAGDWRMPNYLELISLANLGVANSVTWFASFGFVNLKAYGYWSSTSRIQDNTSALGCQFSQRFSRIYLKSGTYQTWPVKGVSTGPARIWKTGQTECYSDTINTTIPCAGTGQDGELQMGEPPPEPRFTDNAEGTVTDNLTGLIWLQDLDCFGVRSWLHALSDVLGLASGSCGLTDGSSAGDWRLPNPLEIVSLSDFSKTPPMLSASHPFINFTYKLNWTSSSWRDLPSYAYFGGPSTYGYYSGIPKSDMENTVSWAVRGGDNIYYPDPIFSDGFEE
jgi:hypothetical protein